MIRVPAQITIPDHYFLKPADVIVEKVGDSARVVDRYGNIITESTDSRYVINKAIKWVYEYLGKGKVLIVGEHEISNPDGNVGIEVYPGIILEGIGEGTVIKNRMTYPGNNYLITNVNRFNSSIYDRNIVLKDMVIDYDKQYPTSPYYPMILFSNVKGLVIENIKIRNHKGNGGHNLAVMTAEDVIIRNVVVEGAEPVFVGSSYYGADGISLGEGSDYALTRGVRRAVIENCFVRDVVDDAVLAGAGNTSYDIKVTKCTIDKRNGYAGSAISIYGSKDVKIFENTIYGGPDVAAIGLRADGSEDIIIECNRIEVNVPSTSTSTVRGKAIIINKVATRVKILNNIIVGDFLDHVIQINVNASDIEIRGNTIVVWSKQVTGQTIRLTNGVSKVKIIGNKIVDSDPNTNYNILLDSTVSDIEIRDNDLEESDPTAKNLIIAGTNILVIGNRFNPAKAIYISGGTYTIKRNKGYVTENSGVATLPAGATSVTVTHGLAATPSKVLITPLGQPAGKLWVANITSTSFDIVTDTAPTVDLQIAWYAEI